MKKIRRYEMDFPSLPEVRYIVFSQVPDLLIMNLCADARSPERLLHCKSNLSPDNVLWLSTISCPKSQTSANLVPAHPVTPNEKLNNKEVHDEPDIPIS